MTSDATRALVQELKKPGPHGHSAAKVVQQLRSEGVREEVYASAITALGHARRWEEAAAVLDEMRSLWLQPFSITYGSLLGALERSHRWERMIAALEEMRLKDHHPKERGHLAVVNAFVRLRSQSMASSVANDMLRRGQKRNRISYNMAMSACEKVHLWKEAMVLLDELQMYWLDPDVITFNALISACGKANEWRQCLMTIDEMRSFGLEPDAASYGAVLTALRVLRRWADMLPLITEMQRRSLPVAHAYASAIGAALRCQSHDAAVHIWSRCRSESVVLDASAQHALMGALTKHRYWRQVLDLFADLRAGRAWPSVVAHNMVASAALRCGDWAYAVHVIEASM